MDDCRTLPLLRKLNIPCYIQIYDIVYEMISNGILKEGDTIPGENAMAAYWNVSRSTIRLAVRKLEEDGLIYKMQGKKTTVTGKMERSRRGITQIVHPCLAGCLQPVTGTTSKITFPGAGVAAMASSEANVADIKAKLQWQTIGPDKINQLRHVKYFKDINGMKEYMKKHAEIIRPKFEAVLETLEKELGELGIASWSKPVGGYFISFNAQKGCAKAIVAKCKEAGLVLTGAGAAYPYGNDPEDSNIRIAPTLPSTEELSIATALFVTCTKLVTVEKLLAEM